MALPRVLRERRRQRRLVEEKLLSYPEAAQEIQAQREEIIYAAPPPNETGIVIKATGDSTARKAIALTALGDDWLRVIEETEQRLDQHERIALDVLRRYKPFVGSYREEAARVYSQKLSELEGVPIYRSIWQLDRQRRSIIDVGFEVALKRGIFK